MASRLFRRPLSKRTISEIALYLLLRLAQRGIRVVDDERFAKLLFFALYTEPGPDGRPALLENPPLLPKDMEFRIYLRGPYIRVRLLVKSMDKMACSMIGEHGITAVHEERGRIIVTAALARYTDQLEESLAAIIEDKLGREFRRRLDDWVVGSLASRSTQELTRMALEALYLETEGPPIKKAMVFNMGLDDYINMLRVLKSIQKDIAEGRLRQDYELDEILG